MAVFSPESDRHAWIRRTPFCLSFLISGGLQIFPRLPILAIMIALTLAARQFRITVSRQLWPGGLLLVLIFLVSLVRPEGFALEPNAVRFINFVAGLALLQMYLVAPDGSLQRDLFAILPWLAIQAVATVLIGELARPLFAIVNLNDTFYQTFLWIFTFHVFLADAGGLLRPDGFFYEPGVFQAYLNIYLFLSLFVYRNARHGLLALVAVLATQSTTGLIIAVIQLVAYSVSVLGHGSIRRRLAVATLGLVVLVPVSLITMSNVTDKFSGQAFGSSLARQYDLITGINVIAEHPLIGIGFDHQRYIKEAERLGFTDTMLDEGTLEDRGNTDGIILLLYSVGIPLAVPFLVGMFRQRLFPHRAVFGILLFLSLVSESTIFTPFFLMIIFSGMLATTKIAASAAGLRVRRAASG